MLSHKVTLEMGKKRSKPETPRPKSDRKAKRMAKCAIVQFYEECSPTKAQENSPPARGHVPVSVAVEQGEISTISPPVPEQAHDHAAVEKVDSSTESSPAPELVPVSVVVEKGDFSTKSPPAPEQVPFSSAVEKGDIPSPPVPGVDVDAAAIPSTPVPGVDLDAAAIGAIPSLRRSEVPMLNNVATPVVQSSNNGDKTILLHPHHSRSVHKK